MEVRLLGPLIVLDDDGQVVEVRGDKPKALLAVLGLRVGDVVSTGRLVEELWGDQEVRDPLNALHVVVSKLRRALRSSAGSGRAPIATSASGYLLDVPRAAPSAWPSSGSIVASIYRSHLRRQPARWPAGAGVGGRPRLLGAALQVSATIGPNGAALADAARGAFVDAMARASVFAAAIAVMAALVAWRYLPARASNEPETSNDQASAPWYLRVCACASGHTRLCDCVATVGHELPPCPCPASTPAEAAANDGSGLVEPVGVSTRS